MPEIYPVGMAEMRIAKTPDILAAYGIGSCIIVAMYDPKTQIGGFSHIMLPESHGISGDRLNPKKFADTAIPLLYQTMTHAGAHRSALWAKVFGGAEMFPPTEDFSLNIGKQNSTAALGVLQKMGIPVAASHVGGQTGRSLEMNCHSGKISLIVLGEGAKEI